MIETYQNSVACSRVRVHHAAMVRVGANWLGTKRWIKAGLSLPLVNQTMIALVRLTPMRPSFARLPVSLREVRGQVGGLSFALLEPSQCTIAKELFWGNGQRVRRDEQCSLSVFADMARSVDGVLDIGANTGIFSIVAALSNPRAWVHAFEIVPEVFGLLVRNIFRNDLATRVTPHFLGIGLQDFTMRVPSFREASSLPTSVSASDRWEDGVHVRFRSLDDFATALPAGRLLLKIDVEGTEDDIFFNGMNALRARRPHILCEVLPGTDARGILPRALKELEYQRYLVCDGYLEHHDELIPSSRFHDWLFTPEARGDLARKLSVPVR